MSILEIVLYVAMGCGFVLWLVLTILSEKKKKAKKQKGEIVDDDED